MELSVLKKAKAQLENINIYTKIENGTLYVLIGDSELELSQYEINWRANKLDEEQE